MKCFRSLAKYTKTQIKILKCIFLLFPISSHHFNTRVSVLYKYVSFAVKKTLFKIFGFFLFELIFLNYFDMSILKINF